jgi:hypothetical protein
LFTDFQCKGLLQLKNGVWKVKVFEMGCTDVCWIGWDDHFHAPKELFPTNPEYVKHDPRRRAVGNSNFESAKVVVPSGTLRKTLIRAARVPIKKDLNGKKSLFKFNHFKVKNNFAFYRGQLVNPDGTPLDYSGTIFEGDEGMMDDNVQGLLKRVNGKWRSVAHAIGCTDVCWYGWEDEFKAPKAIF